MSSAENPIYLVLHGHFYQPPRENPWTQRIERQPSAAPDHDWNQRIAQQCYIPNACSRLLDPQGRIQRILNNYEHISFGFGPLLFAWLQQEDPEAYSRILEADRISRKRNNGHGNAIAQVYNHVILPLADRRDKLTQIRWGKADFHRRFDREPESIWLAETAINRETVECLIQENIRYVILSPHQALRVRQLGGDKAEWTDVTRADIDSSQAYRVFPKDEKGRPTMDGHLDVFFYHGPLAHGISFAHFLRDAKNLTELIAGYARGSNGNTPFLVSAATDGEVYGHHEPFGDMCLAALFGLYANPARIKPVNYGYYLELFPPKMEAELKDAHGEGSSWSCAHGVGRWARDCGCSTGAGPGWNQQWRGALRRGFEVLKAEADLLLEREGSRLFRSPWEARDAYIDVISSDDRTQALAAFLQKHLRAEIARAADKQEALFLLEAQRMIQFSFTSCAWFFADISGIETVQNMIFAARAIELLQPYCDAHLEVLLLNELKEAKSNIGEKTGKDIYLEAVRNAVLDPVRAAAFFAFESLLLEMDDARPVYSYRVRPSAVHPKGDPKRNAVVCDVAVQDALSGNWRELLCAAFFDAQGNMVCHTASERAAEIRHGLESIPFDAGQFPGKAASLFSSRPLSLEELLFDRREQIGQSAAARYTVEWNERNREFSDRVIEQARVLAQCAPVLPAHERALLECVFTRRFLENAEGYIRGPAEAKTPPLWDLSKLARTLGVQIDKMSLSAPLQQRIHALLKGLATSRSRADCRALHDLVQFANDFKIPYTKRDSENRMYEILEQRMMEWITAICNPSRQAEEYNFAVDVLALADAMNFNADPYREALNRLRR